jgi:hypothetical protein
MCTLCTIEYGRHYHLLNRQKRKAQHQAWARRKRAHLRVYQAGYYLGHKSQLLAKQRKWWGSHKTEARAKNQRNNTRNIATLADAYIRNLLRRIRVNGSVLYRAGLAITPEQIEAKRRQIIQLRCAGQSQSH